MPRAQDNAAALLKRFRLAFRGLATDGPERLVPLEGVRLIAEALRSGARLEAALFSRSGEARFAAKLRPQFSKHADVAVVTDAAFRAAMDVEHPQGIAALAHWRAGELGDMLAPGQTVPRLVVAAALQDPGNLGTLIRAADAFGASGVVALAESVGPFHPKAIRASAGSLFHLPVAGQVAPGDLVAACARHGVAIVAASAHGKISLPAADLRRPLCLVIGQEAGGVPRSLQRAAAAMVSIPMRGAAESLNAGVAGAIILYEAMRQRGA